MLYKKKLPDRVCGLVLILRVCERVAQEGLPIYLYGSRPETLEALSNIECGLLRSLKCHPAGRGNAIRIGFP